MAGELVNLVDAYVQKTLRLEHNPFTLPAVTELDAVPRNKPEMIEDPNFFDYYTEPDWIAFGDEDGRFEDSEYLLSGLLKPGPVAVFGDSGMGKTMLMHVVAHECRVVHSVGGQIVLPVYLNVGTGVAANAIARSLATDLFVGGVEKRHTLRALNDDNLVTELAAYISGLEPRVAQVVKAMQKDTTHQSSLTGIARHFNNLGRPVVANAPMTKEIHNLLESLRTDFGRKSRQKDLSLARGLELARQMGFDRIVMIVDGVGSRKLAGDLGNIALELDTITGTEMQWDPLFLLPSEYEAERAFQPKMLGGPVVKMRWTNERLFELIANRFRAVRSHNLSLNQIGEKGLQEMVIRAANGSPRRLVEIVGTLFSVHSQRDPDSRDITHEDWKQLQRQWGADPLPDWE